MDVVTLHSPNPEVLLNPTIEVSFPLPAQTLQLISQMKTLLIKLNGVGLAAPQVGSPQNIFVYGITAEQNRLRKDANRIVPITALVNASYAPTIDANVVYDWEACFSVTDHTGKVPRYSKIRYHAFTPEGEPITGIAEGFEARVLQHEIDHLQGILIIHRLTNDCIQGHPDDMLLLRYQEFDLAQKRIAKDLLLERIKNTQSEHADLVALNKALQILTTSIESSES